MKTLFVIAFATVGLVSLSIAHPVKREQRKFVYQAGYPSVRRYPVYPDRMSQLDDFTPKDLRNENVISDDTVMKPHKATNLLEGGKPEHATKPIPLRTEATEPPKTMESSSMPPVLETTPFRDEGSFLGGFLESFLFPDRITSANERESTPESVFPKAPSSSEPVSSSFFEVFTESPEDSTVFPPTTVEEAMMKEKEEEEPEMTSADMTTITPEMEMMEEMVENNTEITFLDSTATDYDLNTVTEDVVFPTDAPGVF